MSTNDMLRSIILRQRIDDLEYNYEEANLRRKLIEAYNTLTNKFDSDY